MKITLSAIMMVLSITFFANHGFAQIGNHKAIQKVPANLIVKNQTNCPIMGGEVNRDVYTDYQGKRIYFCCAGCPDEFKKDPERYLKKMKEEGITLEDVPKPAKAK